MTTSDSTREYVTITPAGSVFCGQCEATGHPKSNPDVPLRQFCAVHNLEWYWCGGCAAIYCPGKLGQTQPHRGDISPHGLVAGTLPT